MDAEHAITDESDVIGRRLLKQMLELWISPEIERRQTLGQMARPVVLRAAQVVFFAGGGPLEIRINEEVRALARVAATGGRPIKPGDPVFLSDIAKIESLSLSDKDDPNAGHITAWRLGRKWYLFFDFRYNKAAVREHVSAAEQFASAARLCREREWWCPAVDSLFSAAELAAKAVLLSHQGVDRRTSHKAIQIRINRFGSIGNLEPSILSTFKELEGARRRFRYLDGEYVINEVQFNSWLVAIEELLRQARSLGEPTT